MVIPLLAPDPAFGGAYNTSPTQVVYTDDPFPNVERTLVQPWSARVAKTGWKDGKLLPDAQWQAHRALQTARSWREWTEGLPASVLRGGRLVSQRRRGLYPPARFTRTYYLNNVALANGAYNATFEIALDALPAGVSTIASNQIQASGELVYVGTTESTEPNTASWPTGDYRHQLDCLSVNSDVTFGCAALGSTPKAGGFARLNAAISSILESHVQDQAAFAFPGLKLASYSGAWTAGSASDRFAVAVAADRPTGHGNADITFEVGEADDFADGAWSGAGVGDDANFFGSGV